MNIICIYESSSDVPDRTRQGTDGRVGVDNDKRGRGSRHGTT